jgi:2-polyprenyl-6-methoxyphenol hydroxylase-like FAD-dependent oxidoreductase
MSTGADRLDALVVGAGPTGLTMACELRRRGLRVRVVDPAPAPSRHSKALVVHVRTREVFEQMGLGEAVDALAAAPVTVTMVTRDGPLASFEFPRYPGRFDGPRFIDQSTTESLLTARLGELGGAVERGLKVIAYREHADGVTATLATPEGEREVEAAWLLGCDGAHSTVRHLAGIPFEGEAYAEDMFDQADLKIRWDHPLGSAFMFLREQGVAAFLPLPGGRYRIIAIGGEHPRADPTLAYFQGILAELDPRAEAHDPDWIIRFRLHLRMVPRMREGRAFLAGDAAHIHSPAGGQGMNTGIQDAFNLAWKIALVQRGAPTTLLASYDAERRAVAGKVLRLSDGLMRRALTRSRLVKALRAMVIRFVAGRPNLQARAARLLSQTTITYREAGTCVEARRWPRRGPAPGDRAPDLAGATPAADGRLHRHAMVQPRRAAGSHGRSPPRRRGDADRRALARVGPRYPGAPRAMSRGTCPIGHRVRRPRRARCHLRPSRPRAVPGPARRPHRRPGPARPRGRARGPPRRATRRPVTADLSRRRCSRMWCWPLRRGVPPHCHDADLTLDRDGPEHGALGGIGRRCARARSPGRRAPGPRGGRAC